MTINESILGVKACMIPYGDIPSTPITITCLTGVFCACKKQVNKTSVMVSNLFMRVKVKSEYNYSTGLYFEISLHL